MNLEKLVGKDSQIAAVLCLQYGDSGKGKISDMLMREWGDVNARGTGGANAGHTVYVNGKKKVFHLLPVGVTYDREEKISILGQGMVIDPLELLNEIDGVLASGGSCNNLRVSRDAHVVMPYHIDMDRANKAQTNGGIGSTGRGIGPAYADKIARFGVTMGDLIEKDNLVSRLRKIKSDNSERTINIDELVATMEKIAPKLLPFIRDTSSDIHDLLVEGKRIVLEGAQGALLSVEHGMYPYVTSSDCTLNGTASGVGLSARAVDCVLGVCKFPFMSKVGGGPFPTELGGDKSAAYCAEEINGKSAHTKQFEEAEWGDRVNELMNSEDSFLQGIGVRIATGEHGATTGRPRRVGWTDAVSARYAARITSVDKLVLTKTDVPEELEHIRFCRAYELDGKTLSVFPRSPNDTKRVRPIYTRKYKGPFARAGTQDYASVPIELKRAISDFRDCVGVPIGAISTGPHAEDMIIF